jgi:hypothetical protein
MVKNDTQKSLKKKGVSYQMIDLVSGSGGEENNNSEMMQDMMVAEK